MSKKPKDYEVGYAKPPVHSRFQAGQSGNPTGRPKGSLNLATAVNRALKEKVVVLINGRRKSITKLDAAVMGLINRAVKGDAKATQQMLTLAPLVGMEAAVNAATLGADDAALLAAVWAHLDADGGGTPESED